MEEHETVIITNSITQDPITRHEEILTRLLEAAKSEIEQVDDHQRKSTDWNYMPNNTTEQFLE